MSQAQVPAAEARSPGPVLLSVAGGKGPGGTPRASDTVACGPGLREDRRAMTSPEIIESRFWPVIHYDITAMAAPQGLQTLRQDRSSCAQLLLIILFPEFRSEQAPSQKPAPTPV